MSIRRTTLMACALSAGLGTAAFADGYLWLGSEYGQEGSVFRYDIELGQIDLVATPDDGINDHLNNCAVDGQFLYAASPSSGHMVRIDAYTGNMVDNVSFSSALSGHREDGAYWRTADTLWRVTYSGGRLYEISRTGTVLQNYSLVGSSLVGLAWVGDTLMACSYSNGTVGTIEFDGNTATYNSIPWAAGEGPQNASSSALAYDDCDDTLYLVNNSQWLYKITFDNGEAYAEFLVDFGDVGYPSNGLVDGMGWLAPRCQSDINESGDVDVDDLLSLLAFWGPCEKTCAADVDCNGSVDVNDLLALLGDWGPCDG